MTEERCDYLGIRATFVYDGEHRCLNELRASGAHHTYTYAFDGLRRSAHMAGTANAISFVWDGTDLLNEYVSGALSGRYLTLDGEVLSEKRGANRYVYGVDPLGSVVRLLDSGLNRAGTYTYWPYGEVLSHTGVDTPLQFVGNLGYYTSTTNRVYWHGAGSYRPDLAANLRVAQGPQAPARVRVRADDRGFVVCVWGHDFRACAIGGPPEGPPISEPECISRCSDCLMQRVRDINSALDVCKAAAKGDVAKIARCQAASVSASAVAAIDARLCNLRCRLAFAPYEPGPKPAPVDPGLLLCEVGEVCYAVV
jgi:hypothetical protein